MKRTLAAAVISAVLSIIITAVGVSSASIGNELPEGENTAEVAMGDGEEDRRRTPDDNEFAADIEDSTVGGEQADIRDTEKDKGAETNTDVDQNADAPMNNSALSSAEISGDGTADEVIAEKQYSLPQYPIDAETVLLTVNDIDLPMGFAANIGGIIYAPAAELCGLLIDTDVTSTMDEDGFYRISGDGLDISAAVGDTYITSEGRVLWCGHGGEIKYLDGETVIMPIEPICRALGLEYEASDGCAVISGEPNAKTADEVYDSESLYWLSHIISAESRGEPFEGQIAVGCVVLNRLRGIDYLGSVYDVIFDRKYGIQFSPAYSGSVYNEPTESSVRAAKICLEGYSISDSIIYFINSADILPEWMSVGCELIVSIGNHDFYA